MEQIDELDHGIISTKMFKIFHEVILQILVCPHNILCMIRIFRYERLEEQLSDLTELHQNEMTNLKQELASMEEKVAYQSYERARDIQVKAGEEPEHASS